MPVGFEVPLKSLLPSPVKSLSKPTLPTVITGLFVNFLVQPAKLRSDPSNSGNQKRRVLA